jgi:hypothetical protein
MAICNVWFLRLTGSAVIFALTDAKDNVAGLDPDVGVWGTVAGLLSCAAGAAPETGGNESSSFRVAIEQS